VCGFAKARCDKGDGLVFRADLVQEAGDSREIAPAQRLSCCWCGEEHAVLAMIPFMVLLTDKIKLTKRERMCSPQEMNSSQKSVALKCTK